MLMPSLVGYKKKIYEKKKNNKCLIHKNKRTEDGIKKYAHELAFMILKAMSDKTKTWKLETRQLIRNAKKKSLNKT